MKTLWQTKLSKLSRRTGLARRWLERFSARRAGASVRAAGFLRRGAALGWLVLLASAGAASQAAEHPSRRFGAEEVIAQKDPAAAVPAATDNCFLVIMADANGIDYSTAETFLSTMYRHPRGNKQERSVGHSWMILKGPLTWLECGHTGKLGLDQPASEESIVSALNRGDPNPVAAFWLRATNGSLELSSGGHVPSVAVQFQLSTGQYEAIRSFVDNYDYKTFCVRDRVCTDFVTQAAALAGITLGHRVTMNLPSQTPFLGRTVTWWTDPRYSLLTAGSPDVLEKSLKLAVAKGLGKNVLPQYRKPNLAPHSKNLETDFSKL
jgi:hypothetical protein